MMVLAIIWLAGFAAFLELAERAPIIDRLHQLIGLERPPTRCLKAELPAAAEAVRRRCAFRKGQRVDCDADTGARSADRD